MALKLHQDFKDFLKLLNSNKVKYLLIGGYAVGFHGYPRATADLDLWIQMGKSNSQKIVKVVRKFGFDTPDLTESLFLEKNKVIRMGNPPVRIEILTSISGVQFDDCYDHRAITKIDGIKVHIIQHDDLIKNKKASGRLKDLADIEQLK
jgi:predicted nucleotidyltransferase